MKLKMFRSFPSILNGASHRENRPSPALISALCSCRAREGEDEETTEEQGRGKKRRLFIVLSVVDIRESIILNDSRIV
jgi:hypothetical protein